MSLTRARIIQYVGILLALGLIAAGYWYFSARASTKVNKTATASLASGLVGYWTFDGADVSGTTASDRSGNTNNGTLTNGPTVMPGKIGQALNFDATDDKVDVGSGASLDNIETQGGGGMTISTWIKPRSGGENSEGRILSKGGNISGEWELFQYSSNRLLFSKDYATNNLYLLTPANIWTTNSWQHVVVTWNGGSTAATDIHFYINGVGITGGSGQDGTGAKVSDAAESLFIGNERWETKTFDGAIDETRLYNRVLSATEIAGLYDLGKVKVGIRPGDDALEEGLAGYWKLDESAGTSASDASGNGHTGTLTNMEDPADWVAGNIGNSLNFDGVNEYVTAADSPVLDVTDTADLTITGWVNRDTFATTQTIVTKGGGATGYMVYLSAGGRVIFNISDGTDSYIIDQDVPTFGATGWHHFAVIWDQDNAGNTGIYIDGERVYATTTGTIGNVGDASNALAFCIGSDCGSDNFFDGRLDEIRTYHRALSVEEVVSLSRETHPDNPNANLVGHWTFDGMDVSGTTALDRSRGGNRGTLTNGPTVTPGRLGQALNFDGTDDKVNCGDTTTLRNLEDQGGGGMTVMAWIKPRSAGGSGGKGHIVSKENNDSGPGDGEWGLSLLSTSNSLVFGHSRATQPIAAYANNVWATNTWQHVALTFNGGTVASTAIHIYANGAELSHSYDQDGSGAYSTDATASLLIGGGYSAGNGWNFDGLIDDVRVYNRVLSATEIAELYKSFGGKTIVASSGNDTLRSGLVGQWSMDGQDVDWSAATTEVKDRSGNANHGDAINMSSASVTPGRIGQALTFDGTDDYIVAAQVSGLPAFSSTTHSIAFWVKGVANQVDNRVYAEGNDSVGTPLFSLGTAVGGDNGKLDVYIRNDSNTVLLDHAQTTTNVFDGAWHHVAWTDNNGTAKVYVDGIQDSTNFNYTRSTLTLNVSAIGAIVRTGVQDWFSGSIDDVRVFNRVITATEVAQIYNLGR